MKISYKTVYGGKTVSGGFSTNFKCETLNDVVPIVSGWMEKVDGTNPIIIGDVDIVLDRGNLSTCVFVSRGLKRVQPDTVLNFQAVS